MKLNTKLEHAWTAARSIVTHRDEPVAVRKAATEELVKRITEGMRAEEAAEAKRAREAAGLPPEEPSKE